MRNSDLLSRFRQFISEHSLFAPEHRILVAVSGGADSVAMLDLFHRYLKHQPDRLGTVYINHGWDPERHTHEEAFVKHIARRLDIPFHTRKLPSSPQSRDRSQSLESWSRRQRYRILSEVLHEEKYDRCALGHTLDDQAETVLMRLVQGTGLWGLSGIPVQRNLFIRPLMGFYKKDIDNYLAFRNQEFLEDPTNADTTFLRARIRHKLLPELQQKYNPKVKQALVNLAHDVNHWKQEVNKHLSPPISVEKGKIILAQGTFFSYLDILKKFWLQEALQKATGEVYPLRRNHLQQVNNLSGEGKTGRWVSLPGNVRLLRDRDRLILTPDTPSKPASYQVAVGIHRCPNLGVLFQAEELRPDAAEFSADPWVEWMDADKLPSPWVLRTWKSGDRFHPLGAPGHQKVSDFLVDRKVPRYAKQHVLVLETGGRIAWVVGYRMSQESRITRLTKRVTRFEVQPMTPGDK
jgi:tRNA(Ile)-lysidine synthase